MWECENAKMHLTKRMYYNAGISAPAKKKDTEMAVAKREGIFTKQRVHFSIS